LRLEQKLKTSGKAFLDSLSKKSQAAK